MRLALLLAAMAGLAACNPVETVGDVAIGSGQLVLGAADLVI